MVNEPLNEIWSRKRKPLANSLYFRFAPVWALVAVAASDTFTLRLTAGMLVTEATGTDESKSPKRVSCAGHHGNGGSGICGAA